MALPESCAVVVRACIALSGREGEGRAGKGTRRAEGLNVVTDAETDSYTADIPTYVRTSTPVVAPLIEGHRPYWR